MENIVPVMWLALGSFALSAVVFHILVCFNCGKKFWIATDYMWVIGAIFALAMTCVAIRKEVAPQFLKSAQSRLQGSLSLAKQNANTATRIYADYNFSGWPAGREDTIAEYKNSVKWFQDATNATNDETGAKVQEFIRDRSNEIGKDPMLSDSQRAVLMFFGWVDDAKKSVDTLKSAADRSELEFVAWVASTILVGFGLGARCAKVTAQLCGKA